MNWCSQCLDEFSPPEYRPPSIDDPNFCSDFCESAWNSFQEWLDQQ